MGRCSKVESTSDALLDSTPSLSMRNGLSGSFVDFDLLPSLLVRAERSGGRERTTADWSNWLGASGFEQEHVDPDELPAGLSVADSLAADAWRFAERMGFIDPVGLTEDGRQIAALSGLEAGHRHEELASALAERVEDRLRGQGNAPILPLLRRAARALAETTNFWARECPGLIPAEVSAIIHWAGVNPRRADELIDNIVSWRDVAMHRYAAPDRAAPVGSHAQLHFDRVSEFYLEHPWLGERVRLSYAEELALSKLLAYCGLFREVMIFAPSVFCLVCKAKARG